MLFWIIVAILTTAALVAVTWPFLRGSKPDGGRSLYDAEVYRDQLAEVELDLARGLISKAEAEAARTEISRRLLSAAEAGEESQSSSAADGRRSKVPLPALICAVICIPVLSVALYATYGSPTLPDEPFAARLEESPGAQEIQVLVARVEARLREHPEDGHGWVVLAPVYLQQGRYGDAADAYSRALRILGETPNLLSAYGNAVVLANDGVVTEPARKAFERALSADPLLLKARFWLAMAHEQDGDLSKAADAWREMLKRGGTEAPWKTVIEDKLKKLENKIGLGPADQKTAAASAPLEKAGRTPGPTADDMAAAQGMAPSDRSAMINTMVKRLAERLKTEGGEIGEWMRLVRSYTVLGKRDDALKALADARKAFEQDTGALESLDEFAKGLGL